MPPFPFATVVPRTRKPGWLTRNQWLRACAAGGIATSAGAGAAVQLWLGSRSPRPSPADAILALDSLPPGAAVELDGRFRDRTPARLGLAAGGHRVTFRHEGFATSSYPVTVTVGETVTLSVELWLSTPHALRLRPAFPGAAIRAAKFLRDGRVTLTAAIPPGEERQVWLIDPDGTTHRVGPPEVFGSLTIDSGGKAVAYLVRGPRATNSGGGAGQTEVWIAGTQADRGTRRYALPEGTDERLVDLSWAPHGRHLLLLSRQPHATGQRTRLYRLGDDGGEPAELVTLPGEVVAEAYSWSPAGDRLALLTRVDRLVSLCLLGTTDGAFRYLADLEPGVATAPAFPPVAWSPDGARLLYTAPLPDRPTPGLLGFGGRSPLGLFAVEVAKPKTQQVGQSLGHFPAWRADGSTVVLASAKGGALVMRSIDAGGAAHDVASLPLRAPGAFAACWDVGHAQAIVTVSGQGASGAAQPECWLVRFRPDEEAS